MVAICFKKWIWGIRLRSKLTTMKLHHNCILKSDPSDPQDHNNLHVGLDTLVCSVSGLSQALWKRINLRSALSC